MLREHPVVLIGFPITGALWIPVGPGSCCVSGRVGARVKVARAATRSQEPRYLHTSTRIPSPMHLYPADHPADLKSRMYKTKGVSCP